MNNIKKLRNCKRCGERTKEIICDDCLRDLYEMDRIINRIRRSGR